MHRLFRHVQFLVAVCVMSKRRLFRAADLEAILVQPLKSDMSSQFKVISTNRNSRKGGKGGNRRRRSSLSALIAMAAVLVMVPMAELSAAHRTPCHLWVTITSSVGTTSVTPVRIVGDGAKKSRTKQA